MAVCCCRAQHGACVNGGCSPVIVCCLMELYAWPCCVCSHWTGSQGHVVQPLSQQHLDPLFYCHTSLCCGFAWFDCVTCRSVNPLSTTCIATVSQPASHVLNLARLPQVDLKDKWRNLLKSGAVVSRGAQGAQ